MSKQKMKEEGLWEGWGDFLGTGKSTKEKIALRKALIKKQMDIMNDLEINSKMYDRWSDGLITLWCESEGLFTVNDPYIRSFFRNYVDLRKTVEGKKAIMFWLRTHKFNKPSLIL